MTTNASFQSILDRPSSATEKPKPLPVGTYLAMVKGLPEEGESTQKKTPFVKFTLQFLQAAEDVDEEALTEVLKGKALSDKTTGHTLYITEDAAWRLGKFLDDLGIDDQNGTVSFRQRISSAPGRQVMIALKHRASDDGENVFAEIKSTAAVGE